MMDVLLEHVRELMASDMSNTNCIAEKSEPSGTMGRHAAKGPRSFTVSISQYHNWRAKEQLIAT